MLFVKTVHKASNVSFEIVQVFCSWSEYVHVVWTLSLRHFVFNSCELYHFSASQSIFDLHTCLGYSFHTDFSLKKTLHVFTL